MKSRNRNLKYLPFHAAFGYSFYLIIDLSVLLIIYLLVRKLLKATNTKVHFQSFFISLLVYALLGILSLPLYFKSFSPSRGGDYIQYLIYGFSNWPFIVTEPIFGWGR